MLNAFQPKIKSQFITEYFDIQPKLNSFLAVTGGLLDIWRRRSDSWQCGPDCSGLLTPHGGPAEGRGRRADLGDGEGHHGGGETLPGGPRPDV